MNTSDNRLPKVGGDEQRLEVKRHGDPDCPYCAERLRVNVGLVVENKELKRRVEELEHGSI